MEVFKKENSLCEAECVLLLLPSKKFLSYSLTQATRLEKFDCVCEVILDSFKI